jgi:hypothetical protein
MSGERPRGLGPLIPSCKGLILWLAGVACGLAAVAIGALVVIEGGLFDATASTPHNPVVAVATHTAFIRSVQVRALRIQAPPRFTPAQIQVGSIDYAASCAACHGAPGIARASWANGLTPPPPYLSDAGRRWRPRELYWIIGQGAKMTAMPAWAESRSPEQLWDLVGFVEAMAYLTPNQYALTLSTGAERARKARRDPGAETN